MDVSTQKENLVFLLSGKKQKLVLDFSSKKRLMVGGAESCDIVIPNDTVSSIHLIFEYFDSSITVYDMNSRFGTKINGQTIIKSQIKLDESLEIGTAVFIFERLKDVDSAPPPALPTLSKQPVGKKLPQSAPKEIIKKDEKVFDYDLTYPLASDPKADFTEYIFEDSDNIYPIFKYDVSYQSIEVIILFMGRIISVDYISDEKEKVFINGYSKKSKELEYSYLPKNNRDLLFENINGETFVHPLYGHDLFSLTDKSKDGEVSSSESILLDQDDILRFERDDVQIFIRKADAPPRVAHAPILKDDPEFKKYLIFMFLLVSFFSAALNFITVDKEIEKEKIPERIATILYKKKMKTLPSKSTAVSKKKSMKIAKPKMKPVKKNVQKIAKKVAKKSIVKKRKVSKVAKIVKKKVKKTPQIARSKTPNKRVTKRKPRRNVSKGRGMRAKVKAASKGSVDVYKSSSFTSSISNLLAKGGSSSRVNSKVNTQSTGSYRGVQGEVRAGALRKANIAQSGSLVDATEGKLDRGQGVQGIVGKKTVALAGIPTETIAVGMDPSIIHSILMQHLSQFQYCYQKELDTRSNSFNGNIKMNFQIGASGHVTRANATSRTGLPNKVRRCVVNVLKGIVFPEPPGGGIVEVDQPMSFYAKVR